MREKGGYDDDAGRRSRSGNHIIRGDDIVSARARNNGFDGSRRCSSSSGNNLFGHRLGRW